MPRLNNRLMLSAVGESVKMSGVVFLEGEEMCMAKVLLRQSFSSCTIFKYCWFKLLHQNCFSTNKLVC